MREKSASSIAAPVLEHFPDSDGPVNQIQLSELPFQIGRDAESNLVVHSMRISRAHAIIDRDGASYCIRDLGSSNGTYVNGKPIKGTAPLEPGDIIHLAHKEFRFTYLQSESDSKDVGTSIGDKDVPLSIIHGAEILREIMKSQQVQVLFQPIVDLLTEETVAFEALGRGTNQEMDASPLEMFRMAEHCNLATDLSRLFRETALRECQQIPGSVGFFLNMHPLELANLTFVDALDEPSRALAGRGCRLILELNEEAKMSSADMRRFRDRLRTMGIGLAFDDFGAGQSRLAQMAEAPPDFVKLDKELVRNIQLAPARQNMVAALCQVARKLRVKTIAEGVETIEEANALSRLGCQFAQGYLFAKPALAASFRETSGKKTSEYNVQLVEEQLAKRSAASDLHWSDVQIPRLI